jgi:hypothetical protein
MAAFYFYLNIYFWLGMSALFFILWLIETIILVLLSKKTHMIDEFKAWMKVYPIALFFQENRYVEWKPVKPDAGIIIDKNYGGYIINERATYIDKRTKNIIIPFDAQFAASINIHAAKLADDLQYVMKDEEQFKMLRWAIANNQIDETETIQSLKTSVNMGVLKTMLTALIPHNINSKIEKILAARMKNYGKVNVPQVLLLFGGILGAIVIGAIIAKSVLK